MKNILEKLLNGRDLSVDESYNLMVSIMSVIMMKHKFLVF